MFFAARPAPFASLALSLLLAACGGGGSSSADSLSIGPISPAEFKATWTDSNLGLRPQAVLTASFSGTPSGTVYVVVEDPDKLFTSAYPTVSSNTASVTLDVAGALPPGHYTKPLVIHVCKDAGCTSEYAGSPQTVRKDILVESLVVTPARLNFTARAGAGAAAQNVTVTPPAGKSYVLGFFNVNYQSPSGSVSMIQPDEVFEIRQTATGLRVTPKGVAAGRYTWTSWLETTGYNRQPFEIVYDVGG